MNTAHAATAGLKCDLCVYKCKTLVVLKRHMKTVHRGQYTSKSTQCRHCEEDPKSFNALEAHMEAKHPDVGPQFCPRLCGFQARNEATLEAHREVKCQEVGKRWQGRKWKRANCE